MNDKNAQEKKKNVQDDVFQKLPTWCRVILKLKKETEKPKTI